MRWVTTAPSTVEGESGYAIHPAISSVKADLGYEIHPAVDANHTPEVSNSSSSGLKIIQRSEKETEERNGEKQLQKESLAAAPRSPSGSPVVFEEGRVEEKEEQPDLVTLRVEYTALSHQLTQLDANKQAGQWARLYKQVKAAEARLRQAEQDSPSAPIDPPEDAKQRTVQASEVGATWLPPEVTEADERQERLRAIASDLLYWKNGLKVLRQAQLPKWRDSFKWQIEAKIEAFQAEYARLRAEVANEGG